MEILASDERFRPSVNGYVRDEWGGPMIVTRGNLYDASLLPGFVAVEDGVLLGALIYRIEGEACEVAGLFSLAQGRGVAHALLGAAKKAAKEAGCRRLWLVTTNDNTHAIRFYQRYGFRLAAVHIGALREARRLKPSIPALGMDDIALEHEFEFEMRL